ncbi:hypothetical protein HD806DRAFT_539675 [Xylariaceae sp. AK1471]|nr:hypothetical protein HD806DRAFT_539675 [Xylariaceae sp. AK1471]
MRSLTSGHGPGNGASHKAAFKAKNKCPIETVKQVVKAAAIINKKIGKKLKLEVILSRRRHRGWSPHLTNNVVNNGIMKKGEFCKAIGNSNAAVNAFPKERQPMDYHTSEVYVNAWD